ncbi:MAG: hypothetical protein KC464_29525, partial [Myxococcales bacterium]|nr:hypothetical protein [Myxococcales bacterium]
LTGLVWLLVILAAGAALVWVIMDLRTKSADQERRNRAAAEASRKKTEQLEAELADPGAIRITSSPDYAAVWLLLARTPGTSFALPTGQLHELRVELDGHQPVDLQVTAKEWVRQGPDTLAEANLTVALQPGAPATPVKAMPDAPPPELARGLIAGRGVIHVESTPPGAAVWLLVGQTNEMKLEGIEAGRDYDLRVTKDGYLPSYVHISAEEWRSGGDPNLPLAAAPKHGMIERSVELLPDPAAKGEAAKGGRRRAKGSP